MDSGCRTLNVIVGRSWGRTLGELEADEVVRIDRAEEREEYKGEPEGRSRGVGREEEVELARKWDSIEGLRESDR